jgi:adenylyltransferase/sulfurtransferase
MNQITLQELREWMDSGKRFQLIDVREPEEHEAFNIGGRLIPIGEIMRRMDELEEDVPIVLYCKQGIRSMIAIQRLSPHWPECEFYNLRSGIYSLLQERQRQ